MASFSQNVLNSSWSWSVLLYILTVSTLATRSFQEYQANKSQYYAIMPGGEAEQGEEAAQAICIVTETRNLWTQPFVVPDETNHVGKTWEEWLEVIEQEFRYFLITEAVDKKDARNIYGGKEIARLEKSLPDPEIADVYLKLRTKFNDHFIPKKNEHHARYLFLKMRPHVVETTSAYVVRLREKAKECEFGTTLKRESWSI